MKLLYISNIILPILVLIILMYGVKRKKNVYDLFIKGTKEGLEIGINILPSLLAMILSVNILLSSGFIDFFLSLIKPLISVLKIPIEIIPMALMRPISGNTSLILMVDIFNKYGVDSLLGKIASTIQGCTDTTLYILTLYFGSIGIKKIRYAMIVGLLIDLFGIIMSIILVNLIFG
jgi:spore maturation protein B